MTIRVWKEARKPTGIANLQRWDARRQLCRAGRRLGLGVVAAVVLLTGHRASGASGASGASAEAAGGEHNAQQLVLEMVHQEQLPHPDRYEYWNEERSERTGGHLWREHILETGKGKLAILEQVDGKPLTPERAAAERKRLDAIVKDPTAFERFEAAQQNDELRARQMLDSLPRCYVLENVTLNNGVWRIEYRPNPAYTPANMAEKVLHGMSGWFSIDAKEKRLIHLEGHLANPVSLGFGLINIQAGSNFSSDRSFEDGNWRMVRVHTDIRGHALLFKTITHNTDVHRVEFHYLEGSLSIPEAISILEKGTSAAGDEVVAMNSLR